MKKFFIISSTLLNILAFTASADSSEAIKHHIGVELGNDNTAIFYNHFDSGFYGSVRIDSNNYNRGNRVSICNDGKISGSSGSGTCSGHGGVSYVREEKSERIGGSIGYFWKAIKGLYLGAGANLGVYTSEVNIGDNNQGEFYMNLEARAAYRITPRITATSTYDAEAGNFTLGASIGF
ncbi:hypothetical protein RCJ22_11685 [Vibrio sp. FNV 38]|nr:hypothetical protein [Vibrio sp. FNV 38]